MTTPDHKSQEPTINSDQLIRWNERIQEIKRHAGGRRRARALRRKRGDGEIYDVIDEWLAPVFARWIANHIQPTESGLTKKRAKKHGE